MQIKEMYDLANWVREEIRDQSVLDHYKAIVGALRQQGQPFKDQKEQLEETLSEIPIHHLSKAQLEVLDTLDCGLLFGHLGRKNVSDTIQRNGPDLASSANDFQQAIDSIERLIQWADGAFTSLKPIIPVEDSLAPQKRVVVRVHFQHDVGISTLKELRDRGSSWYKIGHGLALASGTAQEEIVVTGASNGSLILTLGTAFTVTALLSGITMHILKVVERMMAIRYAREKVRGLRLQNDQIERGLQEEIEEVKATGINHVVEAVCRETGIDPETEGDKVNALTTAVRELMAFHDKGGELDFVDPEDVLEDEEEAETTGPSAEELRLKFQEIRKLEEKLYELEYLGDSETAD